MTQGLSKNQTAALSNCPIRTWILLLCVSDIISFFISVNGVSEHSCMNNIQSETMSHCLISTSGLYLVACVPSAAVLVKQLNLMSCRFACSVQGSATCSCWLCMFFFFSRVHPDGDAPRAHFEDPSPCLHVRVEAVSHLGWGQAWATFPWAGIYAQAPPALPTLPQISPKYKSGGRISKHVPGGRVCGYSHIPGETSQNRRLRNQFQTLFFPQ